MGTNIGHLDQASKIPQWQEEAAQFLEEHHLVAWAHTQANWRRFGTELSAYLGQMDDTQVCEIPGQNVHDIFSFCTYLERGLDCGTIARSIDAKGGIVDALRSVPDWSSPLKHRYIVWQDADVLLHEDPQLFGRLVDALLGVAAELEYTSEDLLVIQRVVFVGAPSLDVYAEDPRGQFRQWLSEKDEQPLWATITGVEAPPVLRYRIDPMFDNDPVVVRPAARAKPRKRAR